MKQLTVFEMDAISGGYSWDFSSFGTSVASVVGNGFEAIASGLICGAAHAMIGSAIGGSQGGDGGGILGFGAIGQAVGMVWGLVVGGAGGALYGAMGGWEFAKDQAMAAMGGLYNGTLSPWA